MRSFLASLIFFSLARDYISMSKIFYYPPKLFHRWITTFPNSLDNLPALACAQADVVENKGIEPFYGP